MCVPGCQEAVRNALSRRGFFTGAVAAGFAATAIAPEAAQAAPARRFKSTVDLTHTMSPDFPTFFGVPGIEMEKKFDIKKDGFNLYWWRIIEHAGTHLDAPIHFSEAGATAEKIAAETLVVPLAVVDVRPRRRRIPIICSRARILRAGRKSIGGCRTIAASPCFPAGRNT